MDKRFKQGTLLFILGLIAALIWLVFATFTPMLFTGQEHKNTPLVAALFISLPILSFVFAVLALISGWKQNVMALKACMILIILVWLPLIAALLSN